MGLGALGAIAGGVNRGMDWAQRDQEIEDQRAMRQEDREYQRGLRGFQQKQQQRQEDQWNKDDQFQQDQVAIPNVGAVKAIKDTELGPEQVKQTDAGYYRDLGNALKKKGDTEGALKSWKWADEAASKAAANAVVGRLSGLKGSSADLKRIVEEIGAGVDADESPLGIDYKNVRPNGDGSVTVKAFNKRNGFSDDITINSIDDLKEKMTWHYAPDYARAQAEKRQAAADKANEPKVVGPGAALVVGGKAVYQNPTDRTIIGEDANGNPIYGKPTGANSGASSSGKGVKVDDPMGGADDAWEFVSTKGEVKLQPEELAAGRRMTRSIASSGVDPATAAEVAITVMRDPKKGRLEINGETGTIDMIFRDPKINGGRAIAISQSAGTLKDLESSVEGGAATVRGEVTKMVSSIYGNNAQRMIEIAANPELSKQYLQSAQERGLDTTAVANRLDLIRNYLAPAGKPEAGAKPVASKTILDTVRGGFGMRMPNSDPNSPAGRFQARQQDAAKQAEAKKAEASERQSQLSASFKNDLSTMDRLEFVRKYDAIRSRLSAHDAAELRRIENQVFSTK